MLFWESGQIFFVKRAQDLLPKIRNWQNTPGVLREENILRMFFGTFRMQFTQRCGKTLVKILKKSDQNPEIRNKFNFFEGNHLKKSFSE